MAQPSLSLSFPQPDIAQIDFDTPGKSANILSSSVLDEFAQIFDVLAGRSELSGVVIRSGKPGMFIAGADLREFVAVLPTVTSDETVRLCRRGQALFGRLAQLPLVTVAAIEGTCVGGGAELICWCDRRVLSKHPRTEIGFPEVKLGLIPGWGGTVRLPRIVGMSNALEMITSGEPIDGLTAYQMGLANDLVAAEELQAAAVNMIRLEQRTRTFLADRERWRRPIGLDATERSFLAAAATALVRQQTKGTLPAPQAAVELIMESSCDDADTACEKEAQRMATLFGSPINRALLNVFFLTDRVKRDSGLSEKSLTPVAIGRVGVVGAGIMGSGISAAHVKRDVATAMMDADEKALAKGVRSVFDEVSYNRRSQGLDVQRTLQAAPLLQSTGHLVDLASADLVIEAVVENADVKRKIYEQLEPVLRSDAILASNTSTIPISGLAEKLRHPERFCGLHFFNPVRRMQLVEVIRGRKTSDQTVATVVAHAKRIGKLPIVVQDGPGFLVNRLLLPYLNEALHLLSEGVSMTEIDRAAKAYGMPMGPIALYDMVGIDTAFYAGRTMWEAFPDRVSPSPILPALMRNQRLGQKSGRGFFSYQNRRGTAERDPELDPILASYCQPPKPMPQAELIDRLILPMLLEATRVLAEHLVRDPRDIDFGLIYGLGFPAFRGGLLYDADRTGGNAILDRLRPFESLGSRYQPTAYLRELAQCGRKFYP